MHARQKLLIFVILYLHDLMYIASYVFVAVFR